MTLDQLDSLKSGELLPQHSLRRLNVDEQVLDFEWFIKEKKKEKDYEKALFKKLRKAHDNKLEDLEEEIFRAKNAIKALRPKEKKLKKENK